MMLFKSNWYTFKTCLPLSKLLECFIIILFIYYTFYSYLSVSRRTRDVDTPECLL